MKRSDEIDITIRVAVDSDYIPGTPASADGVDDKTDADIDIWRVEWIQWPNADLHWYLTADHIRKIKDEVEFNAESGR